MSKITPVANVTSTPVIKHALPKAATKIPAVALAARATNNTVADKITLSPTARSAVHQKQAHPITPKATSKEVDSENVHKTVVDALKTKDFHKLHGLSEESKEHFCAVMKKLPTEWHEKFLDDAHAKDPHNNLVTAYKTHCITATELTRVHNTYNLAGLPAHISDMFNNFVNKLHNELNAISQHGLQYHADFLRGHQCRGYDIFKMLLCDMHHFNDMLAARNKNQQLTYAVQGYLKAQNQMSMVQKLLA